MIQVTKIKVPVSKEHWLLAVQSLWSIMVISKITT